MSSVIDEIVNHDLCIGCGTCAGICPQKALEIQENKCGEYQPYYTENKCNDCGLCIGVCPFAISSNKEDTIGNELYGDTSGIKYTPETGYHLSSYLGYSKYYRPTCASGGIGTWVLKNLLSSGIVDNIICVVPTNDPKNYYRYEILKHSDEIQKGSGSAYYPLEMSEVIAHILSVPGKYAITGLPCFIKAIRSAQKTNKKLSERIVVTLGLTCGQSKSKYFTTYLSILSGIKEPATVKYHQKAPNKPASDYHFICMDQNGKSGKKIFYSTGIGEAWLNRWFTCNSCNYCDDVFAECADITCMDAWLPEYWRQPEGNNIIIVRSPIVDEIIQKGIKNQELFLEKLPIKEVIRSQKEVIFTKRTLLPYRIKYSRSNGNKKIPDKRYGEKSSKNPILKEYAKSQMIMQEKSRKMMHKIPSYNEKDLNMIKEIMQPELAKCLNIRKLMVISSLPKSAIRRVLQLLQQ